MVAHASNLTTGEVEIGESGVRDQLWLLSNLEANLDYMKSCLQKPNSFCPSTKSYLTDTWEV